MQQRTRNNIPPRARIGLSICAGLLLLLGGDLILTPHAPVHFLPQIGIYMLVTLAGAGVVVGITLILGRLLRRREDYYEQR
ncbi:MAG: hypothetical protein ABR516_05035 [Desulfuromonadaceae bacterium]